MLTKLEKLQALARLQEIYEGPTIQMDVESNPVRLLPWLKEYSVNTMSIQDTGLLRLAKVFYSKDDESSLL